MDSIRYSAAPCPTTKPFLEPSVPDASLLMNVPHTNSYQTWRNYFHPVDHSKKEKSTSILKKQVRFDNPTSPLSHQNYYDLKSQNGKEINQCNNNSSAQVNTPPFNKVLKNRPFQEIYMANIPNRHLDLSLIDLNKPFNSMDSNKVEHLNQNCTDEIKKQTPPQKPPTTYKEFLEMQKTSKYKEETNEKIETNQFTTDIFHYTSPKTEHRKGRLFQKNEIETFTSGEVEIKKNPAENHGNYQNNSKFSKPYLNKLSKNMTDKENLCFKDDEIYTDHFLLSSKNQTKDLHEYRPRMKQTIESSVQTSMIENDKNSVQSTDIAEKSDEPTVKDLLKIIQQQNEQLIVLQKQVSSLLEFKETQKCIENGKQRSDEDNKSVQQKDYLNSAGSTPRKGPLPKFSIDLMTSFEVSFRPQQNLYQRKQRDYISQEPKIQEITETDTLTTNVDYGGKTDHSLHFREPITVQENCPSPEPSINIDMKDYESSEEEEDEDCTSGIGPSFYRKMMDQVNKIIQNAQKQATLDGKIPDSDEMKERTLSKVRDATIKQLKKMNVNFSRIEEIPSPNCSSKTDNPNEQINLAVKQLLMKYLPDDKLSKLHAGQNGVFNKKRSTDKIVLNSRAPQFSFATVQFMKKYDLIASDGNDVPKVLDVREKAKSTRMYKIQQNNPKILDISTLKQQPKLL